MQAVDDNSSDNELELTAVVAAPPADINELVAESEDGAGLV